MHELEVKVRFWDKVRLFYYMWFQTIEVTLLDPCPTSIIILPKSMPVLETSVKLGKVTSEQVNEASYFTPGISKQICGRLEYEFIPASGSKKSEFTQFEEDELRVSVMTDEYSDIGDHSFNLVVRLEEYPDISQNIKVRVRVHPCRLIHMYPVTVMASPQSYNLETGAKDFQLADYEQNPDCGYKMRYDVTFFNDYWQKTRKSWVSFNDQEAIMTFLSADEGLEGESELKIIA